MVSYRRTSSRSNRTSLRCCWISSRVWHEMCWKLKASQSHWGVYRSKFLSVISLKHKYTFGMGLKQRTNTVKWSKRRKVAARPTYEWSPDRCGRQLVRHVDSEDGVAQQYADLEGNACPAVQRQVEADHIHQHEKDAGDEETHHIQQGAPADQHLNEGWGQRAEIWWTLIRSLMCKIINHIIKMSAV